MTFNWPDIPFSGTEVDAFVVAYKALAQSIYDDWENDAELLIGDHAVVDRMSTLEWKLKAPFRNKDDTKIFLENGLIYAAFIVKQRAGNSGPGTDFDLNNSPLEPGLTLGERGEIYGDLGCIFTKEAMECAYQKNNPGKNPPPGLGAGWPPFGPGGPGGPGNPGDPNGGGGGGNGGPPGQGGGGPGDGGPNDNPNDIDPDDPPEPPEPEEPEDCPGKTIGENLAIGLTGVVSSHYLDVKGDLLNRYLTCNDSIFTEDDLHGKKDTLKNDLQDFFDKTSDGMREKGKTIREDVTNNFSAEQLARLGLDPGDRLHAVNFYTTWGDNRGALQHLFGRAFVITDANGNVKGVRDDYDFTYGNEADRIDNSYVGTENPGKKPGLFHQEHQRDRWGNALPIGDPNAFGTTIYPPITEISEIPGTENFAGIWPPQNAGRTNVANNFMNGGQKGQPVPIRINF